MLIQQDEVLHVAAETDLTTLTVCAFSMSSIQRNEGSGSHLSPMSCSVTVSTTTAALQHHLSLTLCMVWTWKIKSLYSAPVGLFSQRSKQSRHWQHESLSGIQDLMF